MSEPLRIYCVCRQKKPKNELIRLTMSEGSLHINNDKQKYFGRSAYICKNESCINASVKKRSLNRAFKREIPQETYDELTKFI